MRDRKGSHDLKALPLSQISGFRVEREFREDLIAPYKTSGTQIPPVLPFAPCVFL
jgi:hypothetical protein